MVDQVTVADKYNVVAANLRTLRDKLAQFTTLQTDDFIVRMDQREARIYGDRVLKLLAEARQVLCEKYDHKLEGPINVEIFPQQSDFAIRTFGLPGGAGFLGVCFGKLITANSRLRKAIHLRTGKAFCGMSSVTWSRCRRPRTACRVG